MRIFTGPSHIICPDCHSVLRPDRDWCIICGKALKEGIDDKIYSKSMALDDGSYVQRESHGQKTKQRRSAKKALRPKKAARGKKRK